jgi:hypothetical protein
MNAGHKSAADGADKFRTAQWSIVLLPVQSKASGSQSALAELRRIYCYEIYAFVRLGHDADEAQNRTQRFFLHLLDHKAVRQVNPLRANSVHFLTANYLWNEADRAGCLKRAGSVARWAITSLEEAMTSIGEEFAA